MGKFGVVELILISAVIFVGIFSFGFYVGKLSGRNAANKEFLNRKP